MYDDLDLLPISGLQHLAFCERQWFLIHMEGEWRENVLTAEGKQLHDYVHEQGTQARGEVLLARGLHLRSLKYGLYGVADMVEFHRNEGGESGALHGTPYPVEYKRGGRRFDDVNGIQLCAQAVCLEEMLGVAVTKGALYYAKPKRRTEIDISDDLRGRLLELIDRARQVMGSGERPHANVGRHCSNCSMIEECVPQVIAADASSAYVKSIYKSHMAKSGDRN